MNTFNRLLCVGILGLAGVFCSTAKAADSNIVIREYNVDGLNAQCLDVVFFNKYIENTTGEIFSGSSTTSGGTNTSSNGAVNVAAWTGTKEFGLTLAPSGAGGSITVNIYGISGTTTVSTGTTNAYLLQNPQTYSITSATSTSFSIAKNPTMVLCSVNVTAGTVSTFLGLHINKAK